MASSDDTTTIILIVFVSFGGLLFIACLTVFAVCCCCCEKMKNKKKNERVDGITCVDEHLKVKEAIVEGHHCPEAVVLEIEDDVHMHGVIEKDEKFGKGLHSNPLQIAQSSSNHPQFQNKAS